MISCELVRTGAAGILHFNERQHGLGLNVEIGPAVVRAALRRYIVSLSAFLVSRIRTEAEITYKLPSSCHFVSEQPLQQVCKRFGDEVFVLTVGEAEQAGKQVVGYASHLVTPRSNGPRLAAAVTSDGRDRQRVERLVWRALHHPLA